MGKLTNKVATAISVLLLSFICMYTTSAYASSETDLKMVSNRLNILIDDIYNKTNFDIDKELKYIQGLLNGAYKDLDYKYKNEKDVNEKIRISKLLNIGTSYGLVIDYIQAYLTTNNNDYLQSAIGAKAIADLLYK